MNGLLVRRSCIALVVLGLFGREAAASQPICTPLRKLTHEHGLRVLWQSQAKRAFDVGLRRVAENADALAAMYEDLELPARPANVNFDREVVIAVVVGAQCGHYHVAGVTVCTQGDLVLELSSDAEECLAVARRPVPRDVLVVALSRPLLGDARLEGLCIGCPVATPNAPPAPIETSSTPSAWREWAPPKWHAALGVMAASDTKGAFALGADVHVGVRGRVFTGTRWAYALGNVAALDLRSRWFTNVGRRDSDVWLVGLRPWMARQPGGWVTEESRRLYPTLLGVLLPEGGVSITIPRNVGGYVAWSLPLTWGPFGDATSRSPFGVEFTPGLVWIFHPGEDRVVISVSLSGGVW